jgi:hypothetical protein
MATKVPDTEVSYLRRNIGWILALCGFLVTVAGAGGAWAVTTYRLGDVETRVAAIEADRAQEKKDSEKMRRNILRICVEMKRSDCEN